jgi:polyhydroxyalkanoate synthase
MLYEPRVRKSGDLTAAAKGRAVLERAKAPHFAAKAPPPSAGSLPNFRTLDRMSRALLARTTQRISPVALAETWADWALHVASAPGKRLELFQRAAMAMAGFGLWLPGAAAETKREAFAEPAAGDRRFLDPAWAQWPFNVLAQGFLSTEDWWREAASNVPGLVRDHEAKVGFMTRVIIDVFSPSNIPWLSPVIINKTAKAGGYNLVRGAANWLEDFDRLLSGKPPAGAEAFEVGRNGHARQGRLPQRLDGADPIRVGDG